jgi:hypothetical protein
VRHLFIGDYLFKRSYLATKGAILGRQSKPIRSVLNIDAAFDISNTIEATHWL